ncbi:hypothetical protein [Caulobacter sp. 17J65-9]|uniref:hypothetical protein n=1 Tax=Caulobacter sp. 17J65-9 TaxID=2709382 RepID=UPI0013C92427|nr:hypothetical protein [Caulobacter sp. 17J65-9]NEX92948.1 hypothetical protein [Caulobacter sp. 17J65-9]
MSKGRPPRARSPQEKKALSYAKDRRNTYGQNDKASRKAIPLRKAKAARADRHGARQDLEHLAAASEAAADVIESSLRQDTAGRRRWQKGPDEPLGTVVQNKLQRRVDSVGAKALRRAAQEAWKKLFSGK